MQPPILLENTEATDDGIRFLLSSDGIIREIKTSWMMVRRKFLLKETHVSLPAELIEGEVAITLPLIPNKLFSEFLRKALTMLPAEAAGWLILNQKSATWRLEMSKVRSSSPNHVSYIPPIVGIDEVAVVDMHTHGESCAYFSSRDNDDDRGTIKISVVFGSLGKGKKLTIMSRLVAIDQFIALGYEDGQFKVRPSTMGKY